MTQPAPSILKPALIGGVVFGVVASIPLVSALNCLCCSLVIAAGFLAGWLDSKENKLLGLPYSAGSGAKVGVLSGLFYAVTASVVGGLIQYALGINPLEQIEQAPNMPPEALEAIQNLGGGGLIAVGLAVNLVFGLGFATIGGLIAGAVFKSEPPVEQPPVQQPPADLPPTEPGA